MSDPKTAPPRRSALRLVVGGLVAAAAAALLSVGAAWWMLTTASGLRAAASLASRIVPGLRIEGLEGSILDGARVGSFVLETDDWTLRVTDAVIEPRQLSPRARIVDIERLAARRVEFEQTPSTKPSPAPSSLALPVELVVRDARIDELAFGDRGATPLVVRRLEFAGRAHGDAIEVERLVGELARMRLQARGRVAAAAPFATEAQAEVATTVHERPLRAEARASGSLQRLQVALIARDAEARADVEATLRLFDRVPLERLVARVEAFDPGLWLDDVPSMKLRGEATLLPVSQPDGTWSVAGPFAVDNAEPGPIDRERVPVRVMHGRLAWAAETLRIDIDRAEGVRGSASGTLEWSTANGVQADARFSGIDASTLHSRGVATELSGQLRYRLHEGEQRFTGEASNARGLRLHAEVDAVLREQVLDVGRARLRLGDGVADLRARLELAGAQAVRVSGSFRNLDLGQLVRAIDTQLNGTFELDGHLREPPAGRARFALTESRIAGRPITGQGTLQLADGRLDADVDLRSGEARLLAKGAVGAGREMRLELSAPDIGALMPGYGGRIEARATVSGELERARIDGVASASQLQLPGGHRVAQINLSVRGGRAGSEPLAMRLDLAGHTAPGGPDTSVAGATLTVRGTTSSANIELLGRTGAQQPIRVVANGGWRDAAWRGELAAAEIGAPLDLLLRTPAPLTLAPGELMLGPAQFVLHGTRFSEFEIARKDGRWRSVGRFDELQPQALDAQARAPRRVVRSGSGDRVPLTLAGRWDLNYTDSVSGIAVVERTGGDIYSGIDALNPIGVSDVGAALNVLNNRVTGNVYVRGRALGKIDAAVDGYIDPAFSGGRVLAQNRPFGVLLDAELPDLSWIGPLIGDTVQFSGRGAIHARIGGTPADPTSTGTVRGDFLRLAWVDQAVRLENGRLDATLEDGVLVINELSFAGTPRVAPANTRALEGLISEKPFEVRAVGRIALQTLTGSVGLKASQLPILQRSDRWMVVSGDAGITLTPERAELYAKLTVDGAYINFSGLRGQRALANDVTVRRAGTPNKATPTAPLDVTLDVQGELGDRFYIEGAGLEARLAGALKVTGRPSQLRGEGSVRTVDGVYAGYGQRLQIERGIVTFQGPVDNPALNVLAVRTGLPVEVGVAISGTAQRPFVRLHSDPAMSDTEKINWLVLGRPPGASDGNDRAMLSAAASALFAGQADSASTNLMRSLGIDRITVQPGQSGGSLLPRETVAGRLRSSGLTTSNSAAADFLAVGKRINDDLYLSFEQALTGAEYFVALHYRLTRNLSLITRAGSTNSLDLVYSVAFD